MSIHEFLWYLSLIWLLKTNKNCVESDTNMQNLDKWAPLYKQIHGYQTKPRGIHITKRYEFGIWYVAKYSNCLQVPYIMKGIGAYGKNLTTADIIYRLYM